MRIAKLAGTNVTNVNRRCGAAASRSAADEEFEKIVDQVNKKYLTSVSKEI